MSEAPSDEHEAILQRHLTGELAEDSQELRDLLAERPELRERLADLRGLVGALDSAGAEQRAVLRVASELGVAPGDEHVAGVIEQQRARGRSELAAPQTRRPGHLVLLAVAAAAALLLALPFVYPRLFPPEEGQGVMLGASALLAPRGDVDDFGEFRWDYDRRPGWYFRVLVRDGTADGDGTEVATSPALETNAWKPADVDDWPREILWELQIEAPGGRLHESFQARARRRGP